jgi:outer membrane protein OmpA-like peptidoglycan-associated protein
MRRRVAFAVLPLAVLAACANQNGTGAELARQPVRVVFFQDDSIALGPDAVSVIQDAANAAQRYPNAPIRLAGFIAPDQNIAPTVALSRARADRVASELARLGVSPQRIQVQGRGTAAVADAPVEARRVEIHIGS